MTYTTDFFGHRVEIVAIGCSAKNSNAVTIPDGVGARMRQAIWLYANARRLVLVRKGNEREGIKRVVIERHASDEHGFVFRTDEAEFATPTALRSVFAPGDTVHHFGDRTVPVDDAAALERAIHRLECEDIDTDTIGVDTGEGSAVHIKWHAENERWVVTIAHAAEVVEMRDMPAEQILQHCTGLPSIRSEVVRGPGSAGADTALVRQTFTYVLSGELATLLQP